MYAILAPFKLVEKLLYVFVSPCCLYPSPALFSVSITATFGPNTGSKFQIDASNMLMLVEPSVVNSGLSQADNCGNIRSNITFLVKLSALL